jgi:hypothetical protein
MATWYAAIFNPSSRKSSRYLVAAARATPNKALLNPVIAYLNLDYVRTLICMGFCKIVLNYF